MGIYIKNCPLDDNYRVLLIKPNKIVFDSIDNKVYDIIKIPENHGRLIDANAMIASVERQTSFLKNMGNDFATIAEVLEKGILQEIENAPTIIPADNPKEE